MNTPPPALRASRPRAWLVRGGLLLSLTLSAPFAGCGGGHHEGEKPSGALCPTGPAASTLTYANFGMGFFAGYCQRCHASAVTGAARNGAPADHVFDTLADIITAKDHIDENAAAGPNAVNTAMPPGAPTPTEDERRKLGEWLACGAPQ